MEQLDPESCDTGRLPRKQKRSTLTVQNGLIFKGQRVVIPPALRKLSKKEYIHRTWAWNHAYGRPESASTGQACQRT